MGKKTFARVTSIRAGTAPSQTAPHTPRFRCSVRQRRKRRHDGETTLQSQADTVLCCDGQLQPAHLSVCLSPQHSVWNVRSHLPNWTAWPIPPAPQGWWDKPAPLSERRSNRTSWVVPPRGRAWHRCKCNRCSHLQKHRGCTPQHPSLVAGGAAGAWSWDPLSPPRCISPTVRAALGPLGIFPTMRRELQETHAVKVMSHYENI